MATLPPSSCPPENCRFRSNLNHDSTLSKGRVIWHLDSKMQKFSGRESQSSILQTSRTTQKRSAMNIAIESYACSIIAKIPWPTTICQRFLPPMLLVILWTATLHIDEFWLKSVWWKFHTSEYKRYAGIQMVIPNDLKNGFHKICFDVSSVFG